MVPGASFCLKENVDTRINIDYCRMNALLEGSSFQASRTFSMLGWPPLFMKSDLNQGFSQIEIVKEARKKTAFVTKEYSCQFSCLPFELRTASTAFQRATDMTSAEMKWIMCLVFIDDIIIYSKSFDECLRHIDKVLQLMQEVGWTIQPSKTEFARTHIWFLEHVMDQNGIHTGSRKVATITTYEVTKNTKEVKSFLGMAGFYRTFVFISH